MAAKYALVVSNGDYQQLSDLQNTHADADAYAQVFSGFGYGVTRLRDGTLDQTLDTLDGFLDQLSSGDEVALIYSGHGWSDGVQNFLIPTDAPAEGSDRKLKRSTLALKNGSDGLLDEIAQRQVGLTVAIIDACRNNPFKAPEGRRSAAVSRGLARLTPQSGSFVIYSAGEGQAALDRLPNDPRSQKLSVFTRSFLPYLKQGLFLEDAVSRAQIDTRDLAETAGGHVQHPAYYDAALGHTCIAPQCQNQPVAVTPAPAPTPKVEQDDPEQKADAFLVLAMRLQGEDRIIALKRVRDGYPGTQAAQIAASQLAALEPKPKAEERPKAKEVEKAESGCIPLTDPRAKEMTIDQLLASCRSG